MNMLLKLSNMPIIMITIDETMIMINSAWGRLVARNTSEFAFIPVTGTFVKGINYIERVGNQPMTILEYPSLFDDSLMNDKELRTFCDRLNTLVVQVKEIPQ